MNEVSGSYGILGKNAAARARAIAREQGVDYLPVKRHGKSDYLVNIEEFEQSLEDHLRGVRDTKRTAATKNGERRKTIQALAKRENLSYSDAKKKYEDSRKKA